MTSQKYNLLFFIKLSKWINITPLHDAILFLHPLETSENQKFSDAFKGYWKWDILFWFHLSNIWWHNETEKKLCFHMGTLPGKRFKSLIRTYQFCPFPYLYIFLDPEVDPVYLKKSFSSTGIAFHGHQHYMLFW